MNRSFGASGRVKVKPESCAEIGHRKVRQPAGRRLPGAERGG